MSKDLMKPNMTFYINDHERFTETSNYTEDYIIKNISFEAWGIFHKLLSLPKGWHFDQKIFANMYGITVSKLRNNLKKLSEHGFVTYYQQRNHGKFNDYWYEITEEPKCVLEFKNSQNNIRHYPNASEISISNVFDDYNKKNVV